MQKLKPKDKLKITKDDIEFEFEVAEEGGYVASVPELPGCVSEGDTLEEALEMIQDAMEGWLHVAAEHGDPIPEKYKALVGSHTSESDG